MPIINGLIGTANAAAAAPYQQLGAASHTLESVLYDLTNWNTPLITNAGKSDRIATNKRFAVAAYTQDDPIDNTSSATILNPVKTVSEQQSTIAQPPSHLGTDQVFNVCQLITDTVGATFLAESSSDRLTILANLPVANEGLTNSILIDQVERKLKVMARWMERCALYQDYQEAVLANQVDKTRGIMTLMASADAAGNNINVPANPTGVLIQDTIESLIIAMGMNGADFENMMIMCSPLDAKNISQAYATNSPAPIVSLPNNRNIAGWNYTVIMTSIGAIPVISNKFMVPGKALFVDAAKIGNVWLPVPGRGNLMAIPLARQGAATQVMLYGQWGFDHGLWNHHGVMTFL